MLTPSDSKITNLLLNIDYSDKISSLVEQHNLITDELETAYHEQDKYPWLCDDNDDAKAHDAYIAILVNVQTLITMRIRDLGGFDLSRAYGNLA